MAQRAPVPPTAPQSPRLEATAPLCTCPAGYDLEHTWSPDTCPVDGMRFRVQDAPASHRYRTAEVGEHALKAMKNRGLKPSTIDTYQKRIAQFAKAHPQLPSTTAVIFSYLERFEDPGYRSAQMDALRALYQYGAESGIKVSNPLAGVRNPLIPMRPVHTLDLGVVREIDGFPMGPRQRVVWELLAGHGWRQIEVRRILAADVRHADERIWIRGKMRNEYTPLLPETRQRLLELAEGLGDDANVIQSREGTPASADTIRRDILPLLERTGQTLKIHGLRKTFATIVAKEAHDENLAMRLIRDALPGQTGRYIERDLPAALERYSPLRLLAGRAKSGALPLASAGEEGHSAGEYGGSAWESNPPQTGKPARQRF